MQEPSIVSPPAAANITNPPPASLTGHEVPPERMALITPHVRALAETALAISTGLPLQADAGDFAATLEAEEQ
jgi:hypothetical protein